MKNVVIIEALRTAIGSFNGALAPLSAVELGSRVAAEVLTRSRVDAERVDEVIWGNVLQAGLGQNVARQTSLHSGISATSSAYTVNQVCGSGLKSVNLAAQSIAAGNSDIVLAGGAESMSNAPYLLNKARWGHRMGHGNVIDSMIQDGLWCAFNDYHMGLTAENVAEACGISREAQDEAALLSQQKAVAAIQNGAFRDEIVPLAIRTKKGETIFDTDEYPKAGTSLEGLAKLRPAFKEKGTVTAGNASGINDGAAALLLMSEEKAVELGLNPIARIVSHASAGVDPSLMGLGPLPASRAALQRAGLAIEDIDLFEANEAFAAQFLAVGNELRLPAERVNINGGAIALGHPIGASGARILVTLLHALKNRGLRRGLATLCIGGGQGTATIVETL